MRAGPRVAATQGAATGLLPLTGLVLGSMIGGGVFNLPSDLSAPASPAAIVVGWCITGVGLLALAFVYRGLRARKRELNSGFFARAKAGFGSIASTTLHRPRAGAPLGAFLGARLGGYDETHAISSIWPAGLAGHG